MNINIIIFKVFIGLFAAKCANFDRIFGFGIDGGGFFCYNIMGICGRSALLASLFIG